MAAKRPHLTRPDLPELCRDVLSDEVMAAPCQAGKLRADKDRSAPSAQTIAKQPKM
jgi:hypothetical protein